MTRIVLGGLVSANGRTVQMEELPPSAEDLQNAAAFFVKLSIEGLDAELDIAKIRQLKRLVCEGEKQLLMRHEQAASARNLKLDF